MNRDQRLQLLPMAREVVASPELSSLHPSPLQPLAGDNDMIGVVVIPVLARSPRDVSQLRQAVHSVAPYPVIVVDDGSSPALDFHILIQPTSTTIDSAGASEQSTSAPAQPVRLVRHQVNLGPGAARNSGWVAGLSWGADVILCMDADCIGSPAWASGMLRLQAAEGPALIGGVTRALAVGGSTPASAIARFHDRMGTLNPRLLLAPDGPGGDKGAPEQSGLSDCDEEECGTPLAATGSTPGQSVPSAEDNSEAAAPAATGSTPGHTPPRARSGLPRALYVPTCNMSAHGEALRRAGGFDESFPRAAFEDVEMCVRARKRGVQVLVAPGCPPMLHAFDETWAGFCSQFARYGGSHPQMVAMHPEYDDWYASSEEMAAGCEAPEDSRQPTGRGSLELGARNRS